MWLPRWRARRPRQVGDDDGQFVALARREAMSMAPLPAGLYAVMGNVLQRLA